MKRRDFLKSSAVAGVGYAGISSKVQCLSPAATQVVVIDSKPPRVFNREAIRAILKWKFKPRVIDGVAVDRTATQIIDFSLDQSGS